MAGQQTLIIGIGSTGYQVIRHVLMQLREVGSVFNAAYSSLLSIEASQRETPVTQAQTRIERTAIDSEGKLENNLAYSNYLYTGLNRTDSIAQTNRTGIKAITIKTSSLIKAICLKKSGMENREQRVLFLSSIAGGTGSGIFFDLVSILKIETKARLIEAEGGYRVPKRRQWFHYPHRWKRNTIANYGLNTHFESFVITKVKGLRNKENTCYIRQATQTTTGDRLAMNPTTKRINRQSVPLCWFEQTKKRRKIVDRIREFGFKQLESKEQNNASQLISSDQAFKHGKRGKGKVLGCWGKNTYYSQNNNEVRSILTTKNLVRQYTQIVETQLDTEHSLPIEAITALNKLGDEIRELRTKLRVNRAAFSKQVGIDEFSLLAVENSALRGNELRSLITKIDHSQHTHFLERFTSLI